MTDFLRLPRWDVLAVHEHHGGYRVDAAFRDQPPCCLRCGADDALYRHGVVRGVHALWNASAEVLRLTKLPNWPA